jgi:RHS repeat-associated protein
VGVFNNNSALGIEGGQGRAEVQMARDGKVSVTKYDLAGRVAESYTLAQDAEGRLRLSGSATEYNEKGQSVKSYRLTGVDGSTEKTLVSSSSYDADGRLETSKDELTGAETAYGYDATGRQVWTRNPKGIYTVTEYNALGQVYRTCFGETDPESVSYGNFTEYGYDEHGRRILTIDPEGVRTRTVHDEQGRVSQIVYAAETSDAAVYIYSYDSRGNRTKIVDARGKITKFVYDAFNRSIQKTLVVGQDDAESAETNDLHEYYSYDPARGLLTSRTDFNGRTVSYRYDPLTDRQTRIEYPDFPDRTGETRVVEFDYRKDGKLLAAREYSRYFSPSGPKPTASRTTSYTYDPVHDRPSFMATPEGTIAYQYDNRGMLTQTKTSSGHTVRYGYDPAGRLQEVWDAFGSARYAYDINGNQAEVLYPNGTSASYTYDDLDRLTLIENKSGENILFSAQYSFSSAGCGCQGNTGRRRLVEERYRDEQNVLQERRMEYSYDVHGRLTEENYNEGAYMIAYTYDEVGNRLTKYDSRLNKTTQYAYNNQDQILSEDDGTTLVNYSYDGNGNLIGRTMGSESMEYLYDIQNRLIAAMANGQDDPFVRYAFDYFGSRFLQKTEEDSTAYLVDHSNPTGFSQVLCEYDGTGSEKRRYTYGRDLVSVSQSYLAGTLSNLFYQYDALGSVRVVSDENGAIANRYGYTAFGEEESELTSETFPQSYRFTGERYDDATEFYYLRARMYDPRIGRFTATDPVEDQANRFHLYDYCHNDPVNYVDLGGRQMETLASLAVGLQINIHTNASPWNTPWLMNRVHQPRTILARKKAYDVSIRALHPKYVEEYSDSMTGDIWYFKTEYHTNPPDREGPKKGSYSIVADRKSAPKYMDAYDITYSCRRDCIRQELDIEATKRWKAIPRLSHGVIDENGYPTPPTWKPWGDTYGLTHHNCNHWMNELLGICCPSLSGLLAWNGQLTQPLMPIFL